MSSKFIASVTVVIATICMPLAACSAQAIDSVTAQKVCSMNRTPTRPMAAGKVTEIAQKIAERHVPGGRVLLCAVLHDSLIFVESWSVLLTPGEQRVLVIWMNPRFYEAADDETLRFAIAHEVGHSVQKVGPNKDGACPQQENIPAHIVCEHEIDRYAAQIVGLPAALHALETGRVMLMTWRLDDRALDTIDQRIRLLREDKSLVAR